MIQKKHLVVIAGPTAVGKTSTTIKLGQYFNCEIINADSRQFYKEMTIGTAKPSEEELNTVHHHFINNLSIQQSYSIGDFERDSSKLLKKIFQKENITLMTGGSGMYIRAITEGLDEFPNVAVEIVEALNLTLENKGIASLQQELNKVDPTYYQKIDIHNPRRIIRALSVYEASGQPFSSFLNQKKEKKDFDIHYILLTRDRQELYNRINLRVDLMIEAGLEAEAKLLYPFRQLKALQTVGYQELFSYFSGEITKDKAIELIKRNSRRYAKRQLTWFRKRPYWKAIHADNFDRILETVRNSIDK